MFTDPTCSNLLSVQRERERERDRETEKERERKGRRKKRITERDNLLFTPLLHAWAILPNKNKSLLRAGKPNFLGFFFIGASATKS